jgi:ElaB/YqjD/DUF883 family membrane-anchored ribosome-binding protein
MENKVNRGMTETGSNISVHEELIRLRDGFNQLRADVAELVTHAFDVGRSGANVARDYSNDAMEEVKQRVNDLRTRGADRLHTIEHRVEENPLASALIALGVGFVVAKIMHRRR